MLYCVQFHILSLKSLRKVVCLQDVRKTIILSLPPTNATSAAIIDCMLDVSEPVRKAAYCVLASKFPLQSLR